MESTDPFDDEKLIKKNHNIDYIKYNGRVDYF